MQLKSVEYKEFKCSPVTMHKSLAIFGNHGHFKAETAHFPSYFSTGFKLGPDNREK